MKLLRKPVVVTILTLSLVCGTTTAQAGVVPWMWNALFGPAHAPWFGPNNRGYGCRPVCRPVFRPCVRTYRYAPINCYPINGCNTGCSITSYSSSIVATPVSLGCEVAPAGNKTTDAKEEYEDPAPVGKAGVTDPAPGATSTDETPRDEFNFDDPKPSREAGGEADFGPIEDEDWTKPVKREEDPEAFDFRESEKPVTDPDGATDADKAAEPEGGTPAEKDANLGRSFISTVSLTGPLTRDAQLGRTRVFTRASRTSASGRTLRWSPQERLTARR